MLNKTPFPRGEMSTFAAALLQSPAPPVPDGSSVEDVPFFLPIFSFRHCDSCRILTVSSWHLMLGEYLLAKAGQGNP